MFTTLPGAVEGVVSDSIVLHVLAVSVGALPHISLFGSRWCWTLDMCLAVCVLVCAHAGCLCM